MNLLRLSRTSAMLFSLPLMALGLLGGSSALAQDNNASGQGAQANTSGKVPLYRVTVVGRTTKAINYLHRSGPTQIAFQGTDLMPEARGQATVNSKQGRIEIKTQMERLTPATQFGPEYLTYVLWAVTPEGRPKNLGEVLLNGQNSHMEVTTDLQTFGLIVTAEPYFAVTEPSDVVVMENVITNQTSGTIQPIETRYELLQRGQYVVNARPGDIQPLRRDKKTPLELYEARNAVRIARWTGAEQYASDSLRGAEESLQNAEEELNGKTGKKTVAQNSRDAAQKAEDARLITIQKINDERLTQERAAASEREEQARTQALQAQSERDAAVSAKAQADQAKAQAEVEAERAAKEKSDADAAREAERAQQLQSQAAADQARIQAEADAQRAVQAKADAEAARDAAQAQQRNAESEAERARQAAAQADQDRAQYQQQSEQEKAQLREQLRQQLNSIMETRETAQGLIVNMSDVLFDTGKHTLKPEGREKLAKVAGVLISHPGLKVQANGHTDNVGSDELNQRLSEERADSVREYLIAQNVPPDSATAQGFGKTDPVAPNETSAGRQLNRRVELVVSGDVIGAEAGGTGR